MPLKINDPLVFFYFLKVLTLEFMTYLTVKTQKIFYTPFILKRNRKQSSLTINWDMEKWQFFSL